VNEIWLTSQDTACYGKDIAVNLVGLLNEVCETEEKFFVRVGMMTPNHALSLLDDLVDAYMNEKIFKFLHLPVQSGDDRVLRLMNRLYSVEDFKKVVRTFRKRFPKMTIATDVICGFPGENRGAFEHTLQLIDEVQPDILNVSKFFPRPRTPAAEMRQLPPQEVKERSRKVAELARKVSLERNQGWLGWEGEIVIDEEGKRPTSWIGRNFAYRPIVVRSDEILHGRFVDVRVVRSFRLI
jgi:MiaB/RimO family radical SAM methylthiotransferase